VEQVRSSNRKVVTEFHKNSATVVTAWCGKSSTDAAAVWTDADGGPREMADDLEKSGRLDFRILSYDRLIQVLRVEDLWPARMPLTTSLDALGLTVPDVSEQDTSVERERRRKRDEKRSIKVDGQSHIAEPEDYGSIAGIIRQNLSESFLGTSTRMSKLQKAPVKPGAGTRVAGRGGNGKGAVVNPSNVQKNAIGFVGEVLAYEWLQAHHEEDESPIAWRSTYRRALFGGDAGDDGLGYDFEVVLKSRTLCFEVKATSTDRLEIEMGESEVKCARKYARSKRFIYRLIFIRNALDSERRSLHVLPNPFSAEGQEVFRSVGSGLRYQFKLS
jgi:hypothetical protein